MSKEISHTQDNHERQTEKRGDQHHAAASNPVLENAGNQTVKLEQERAAIKAFRGTNPNNQFVIEGPNGMKVTDRRPLPARDTAEKPASPNVDLVLKDYDKFMKNGSLNMEEAGTLMKELVKLNPQERRELLNNLKSKGCNFDCDKPLDHGIVLNKEVYVNMPPSGTSNEIIPSKIKDLASSKDPFEQKLTQDLSLANCHCYALHEALKNNPELLNKMDAGPLTQISQQAMEENGFRNVSPQKLKAGDIVAVSFDGSGEGTFFKHSGVVQMGADGKLVIVEKFGPNAGDKVFIQSLDDFQKSWAGGDSSKIHAYRPPLHGDN
jgi:hypothetical protein